jgi:hypothetical protein
MKRFFTIFLALVLVYAFAVPAYALENIFGGAWRTRAYVEKNYSGDDSESQDVQQVDTRTRLYYTAKFSDNFKFVNKFEIGDAVWGTPNSAASNPSSSYTDFGADGVRVEVKNSYVDFTLAPVNFKVGVQPVFLSRGFIMDDDVSGAVVTYNLNENVAIPFIWMKAYEGGYGKDKNDQDVDWYVINPSINAGGATIAPIFLWVTSQDARAWSGTSDYEKFNAYLIGADVDAKVGPASIWFTGLYEFGKNDKFIDLSVNNDTTSIDIQAYLVALGGSADAGPASVHAQFFYASGQDTSTDKIKAFTVPNQENSYDWAPIMGGNGIFDNQNSNGSAGFAPSNIMAAQIGATFKPMPKLSLTPDIWWAQKAEDNPIGDKDLGIELDLTASYSIMDNLNLDVVLGYLIAGKATTDYDYATDTARTTGSDKDPFLFGTQLSLSF